MGVIAVSRVRKTLEQTLATGIQTTVQEVYQDLNIGLDVLENRLHVEFNSANNFENSSDTVMNLFSNMLLYELNSKAVMNYIHMTIPHPTKQYAYTGIYLWEYLNGRYTKIWYSAGSDLQIASYLASDVNDFLRGQSPLVPSFTGTAPESIVIAFNVKYMEEVKNSSIPTGIITAASSVNSDDQLMSGVSRQIRNSRGDIVATLTSIFYAGSHMKKILQESNPSKKGFIVVFQDDGVIIADSFVNSTYSDSNNPCHTDIGLVKELCDKISENGGFNKIDISVPNYKTKHGNDRFIVIPKTVKLQAGHQIRVFLVLNTSEFNLPIRRSSGISAAIAVIILASAIMLIFVIIQPISRQLSLISQGYVNIVTVYLILQ
jgi:hypothetical protein